MKTPMQEHIEWLKKEYELILKLGGENQRLLIKDCIENAEAMLEKEKEVMCEFADDYQRNCFQKSADDYFKETFNSKEK